MKPFPGIFVEPLRRAGEGHSLVSLCDVGKVTKGIEKKARRATYAEPAIRYPICSCTFTLRTQSYRVALN
jgi:hypothetical protein